MNQASRALCALGGFLALVAGCKTVAVEYDIAAAGLAAAGQVRVLDGSPDHVALTLQDMLERRGLEAVVVKTADMVVVDSKTSSGLRFALLLQNHQTADGRAQTRVAWEWMDSRKDLQASGQFFSDIDKQAKK
jgi:hypothetical protein